MLLFLLHTCVNCVMGAMPMLSAQKLVMFRKGASYSHRFVHLSVHTHVPQRHLGLACKFGKLRPSTHL